MFQSVIFYRTDMTFWALLRLEYVKTVTE